MGADALAQCFSNHNLGLHGNVNRKQTWPPWKAARGEGEGHGKDERREDHREINGQA